MNPPSNVDEYLKSVKREARRLPNVVVAAPGTIEQKPVSSLREVLGVQSSAPAWSMRVARRLRAVPCEREYIERVLQHFERVRTSLATLEPTAQTSLLSVDAEELKHRFDNETLLTLADVLNCTQLELRGALRTLCDENFGDETVAASTYQCQVLYSLLTRLDFPVDAETSASLRVAARQLDTWLYANDTAAAAAASEMREAYVLVYILLFERFHQGAT